jgi:hypothetical protein
MALDELKIANGEEDLADLGTLVNGGATTDVVTRYGGSYPTIRKLLASIVASPPVGWLAAFATGGLGVGSAGPPGANVMAVPSFISLNGALIPSDTRRVDTAAYSTGGALGYATYLRGDWIDAGMAALHPRAITQTVDEDGAHHYWYLVGNGGWINSGQFGAVNGTNPKRDGETASPCADAVEACFNYQEWLGKTRLTVLGIDDTGLVSVGLERDLLFDRTGELENSFWNTLVWPVMPGHYVAITNDRDYMIKLRGKSWDVRNDWQLYGALFNDIQAGYSHCLTKDLLIVEDAGGSKTGAVRGEGCRGWAYRCSDVGELAPYYRNNIPLDVGYSKVANCGGGWGPAGTRLKGNYSGGNWVAALSDNYGQRHRVVLAVPAGCNPNDIELYAPYKFGGKYVRTIQNIVSIVGQNVTVDLYPILPETMHSGTYEAWHGGGFAADGVNLANSIVGGMELLSCAVALRLGGLFLPNFTTLLAESCRVGVQIGKAVREAKEGGNIGHYHIESVEVPVLSVAAVCNNVNFGTKSALTGSPRGLLDTSLTQEPAIITGGTTYVAPYRRAFDGVGFHFSHGWVYGRGQNVEYNQLGNTNVSASNDPSLNDSSPRFANAPDIFLTAVFDRAEKLDDRRCIIGPFYGDGPGGSPSGNCTFKIVNNGIGLLNQRNLAAVGGIAGDTLTISSITAGAVWQGQVISGPGIAAGTVITDGDGGVGTYKVDPPQTVAAGTAITSPTSTIEGGINLDGTPKDLVLSGFTGPVKFECIIELPQPVGNNVNWKIIPHVMGKAAASTGGGLKRLPVDPLTKGAKIYVEPARSAMYTDAGTATPANPGDGVGHIADLSGGNYHPVYSTGTRPKLRKLGGRLYLEGNGTSDWLKSPNFDAPLAQPYTVVLSILCADGAGSLTSPMFSAATLAALQAYDGGGWRMYAGNDVHGGSRGTVPRRLIVVVNGADSEFWVDGELAFTGDFGANTWNGLYLFVASSESSQFSKSAIFAAGLLAGHLDDIPGVDAWLAALAE